MLPILGKPEIWGIWRKPTEAPRQFAPKMLHYLGETMATPRQRYGEKHGGDNPDLRNYILNACKWGYQ